MQTQAQLEWEKRTITAGEVRKLAHVNWKNEHSRRLQQLTGDPDLVVGFEPAAGVWKIARLVNRMVVSKFGQREMAESQRVPLVWAVWVDSLFGGPGNPLPIHDPRLEQFVRASDTRQNPTTRMVEDAALRESWRQEARQRDLRDRARDLVKPFKDAADCLTGFVGREGAGGTRKHFYKGCLAS